MSRANTELSGRVAREHADAARLTDEASGIRRAINKDELANVVAAASEANALIDQRTFSWTEFFNRIEETMPPDVMLTSVRPTVRDGETLVTMVVLARRAEDIDEFIEKLEATGTFENLLPTRQGFTESGLYEASIAGVYTGTVDEQPDTPAPAAPPPSEQQKPGGGQ